MAVQATSATRSSKLRRLSRLCGRLALAAGLAGAAMISGAAGRADSALEAIGVPRLSERLAALRPSSPREYFLLAEEVSQERHVRDARVLAERLYVLAYELDRSGVAGPGIAPSACLGLAGLTPRAERRAWLRGVARLLQPAAGGDAAQARREGVAVIPPIGPDQASIDLATALGLVRAGEGRRAAVLLDRPGVRALLLAYEPVLSDGSPDAFSQRLDRWITQWPQCPTCSNRRVIQRNGEGRLCTQCEGQPGPKLGANDVLQQIRAESYLLRGVYASWAAQTLADRGEPLREPEPERLAEIYEINPRETVFEGGRWREP